MRNNLSGGCKSLAKQAGVTLMEVISYLLIAGLVAAGALSLFSSADASQRGNQMLSDITALRAAIKGLYSNQGGFGTANLNGVLKASNKLPGTMSANGDTPPVITHNLNGTLTAQGATSNFTLTVTNIPTDVCSDLLSRATNMWVSVKVGAAAAITTFPVAPDTASNSTYCGAAATNTMVFTAQ